MEATAAGKPFRQLTGADRLVIYTLAANTGLRAKELASLMPASFDFEAKPPTVHVRAAYSKRRQQDSLPLRADVAELLRGYIARKARHRPLWPGTWKAQAADMIRRDLAAQRLHHLIGDIHAVLARFPLHRVFSTQGSRPAQLGTHASGAVTPRRDWRRLEVLNKALVARPHATI